MPYGPQSKAVHCVGNRVPFGMKNVLSELTRVRELLYDLVLVTFQIQSTKCVFVTFRKQQVSTNSVMSTSTESMCRGTR